MNSDIAKAIKAKQEIILSLFDGSELSGVPSWGEDRIRVRIISPDRSIWVPLDEIEHVTTLLTIIKSERD